MGAIRENKAGLKVLIPGAILQMFLGILYIWSVFAMPVSQFFSWDIANAKLTASFMLSFFVIGILAGGKLSLKIGAQKVVLLGGILLSMGMLMTAFVPKDMPWLIHITYGIIGGFGVGAGYNTIISAAQKWFPSNRGFATGVAVCAFGFSTVVFAPLVEYLIGNFGLQTTFKLLAAGFLITVLALFRFIKFPENQNGNKASAALLERKQYTIKEILKTKEFYYITFSLMLGTSVFFILNPSFKTLAVERGLAPTIGTLVVMITGVSNALGRLAVPFFSDKIGRERAAMATILITMISAIALCFVTGGLFILTIGVIAFCYGGYSGVYPVITADYFGIKNVGSNYGAVMVGFALSALFFPIIIGSIEGITAKFLTLAGLALVGAFLVVLLMKSSSIKKAS